MKRENLTWQELWPLIGDGQCFEYQEINGPRPYKFVDAVLYVWSTDTRRWCQVYNGLARLDLYKLVDDPSKPQPKEATELSGKLYEELNAHARQMFDTLEHTILDSGFSCRYKLLNQHALVSSLVSMFELLREDLIWEIEERKS